MSTDTEQLAALDAQLAAAVRAGDWAAAETLGEQADRLAARVAAGFTCHAAALWYASIGLPVFPLMPGQKQPWPRSKGCHDATTDPATINAWWAASPTSNVAIATGHLLDVIDVDGPTGAASWAGVQEGPAIVGRVNTPRPGGAHLYIAATGSGNRAGMFAGVDYRGVGGYVVAPPSYLEAGHGHAYAGTYRWSQPLGVQA